MSQSIWFWRSAGFDNRNSMGVGGTETLLLEGTQSSVYGRTQEQKQWHYRTPGQTYLLVLRGLQWRLLWLTAEAKTLEAAVPPILGVLLAWAFQETPTCSPRAGPTPQPAGFSAVWPKMPQTKQPAGWEHSPTHQQTGCLVILSPQLPDKHTPLTRPYSPEGQDPALPPVGRNQAPHKEAGTSPLDQSRPARCRQQKQELQPCRVGATITESKWNMTAADYVTDKGTK